MVLSLVVSFMFFVFEPITMYANNIDDFWFDFYTLINPTIVFFTVSSLALILFFILIRFVSKKVNKPAIYNFALLFSGGCFLCAYIHSNFLAGFLPSLDGTTLAWDNLAANLVSILVCLAIAFIIIFANAKLGFEKVEKFLFGTSLTVFAMLAFSLVSTCLMTPVFETKDILALSTNKNLYTISKDRNYIIFLADMVDSTTFNEIVQSNPEYKEVLKDFSYFPDTLAGYAFTRDSVPFIFSGEWNENQTHFSEYSTNAFDNSKFFEALAGDEWLKNLYYAELLWRSEKAFDFDNIVAVEHEVDMIQLAAQEMKYILFKSLPFPLKRFSRINTMHFEAALNKADHDPYSWWDLQFYHDHQDRQADITDKKLFQYIHLEGGHMPFDVSAELDYLPDEDGTYPEKVEATMEIFAAYLDYLKNNGAYNNATIVFMSDHGYEADGWSRQNPILFIKGPNEHHDQMVVSDKQVSYEDLCETFIELLDGKSSTEVFSEIPTVGRTRRHLYNYYQHEEHMIEYEQTDKAWNEATLKPTGRSFDLK